ncbi:hypothetical protein J2Z69_001816 [Paenibacillus shirakamiensis]|uniref:Uncharacterized protein n=1 Tax=Paenibacillus shirakamiensis TaxID=1265935 RepID=A0ABS4JI87_9BACL|nr:hypothetical protein [Paenibacillus shirakamiensis]MBP2000785.1 hypothetical protein [Paenibacillus shirakamiensis]
MESKSGGVENINNYILPKTNKVFFCPKCGYELYFEALTSDGDYFFCPNIKCYTYYFKPDNEWRLEDAGSYQTVIDYLRSKGLENWPGIPSSQMYQTRWRKFLNYFKKQK